MNALSGQPPVRHELGKGLDGAGSNEEGDQYADADLEEEYPGKAGISQGVDHQLGKAQGTLSRDQDANQARHRQGIDGVPGCEGQDDGQYRRQDGEYAEIIFHGVSRFESSFGTHLRNIYSVRQATRYIDPGEY